MNLTYVSTNQTKAFRYDAVQAFDYYPQWIGDQMVPTLRVLLSGGDQWYEGAEAVALYGELLRQAKTATLGT